MSALIASTTREVGAPLKAQRTEEDRKQAEKLHIKLVSLHRPLFTIFFITQIVINTMMCWSNETPIWLNTQEKRSIRATEGNRPSC